MNRALEGYNKVAQKIAEEQESLIKNKPEGYKKRILELNALAKKNTETAVKTLGKDFKGTIGHFRVDPDTGEFLKKGGDFKKTFAGIEGEDKIFKDMTGKERKTFERKISNLEKLKTLPEVTTASKIKRPEKALEKEMFKTAFKKYDHHDPSSYLSDKRQYDNFLKEEIKETKTFGKATEQIKDLNIPKGTLLKASAKGILRAVSPFIPFVGAVGVGLGISDAAKAAERGLENEELGIAYLLGPELAQKYSDIKDRGFSFDKTVDYDDTSA